MYKRSKKRQNPKKLSFAILFLLKFVIRHFICLSPFGIVCSVKIQKCREKRLKFKSCQFALFVIRPWVCYYKCQKSEWKKQQNKKSCHSPFCFYYFCHLPACMARPVKVQKCRKPKWNQITSKRCNSLFLPFTICPLFGNLSTKIGNLLYAFLSLCH